MRNTGIIEVSTKGMRALAMERGIGPLLAELIANALDEQITWVSLNSKRVDRGLYTFRVEDDSPLGFRDLSESYMLFAESYKKANPTLRGRFNAGEKHVLSACEWAEILSTTGGFRFDDDGRHTLRRKREFGTLFTGAIRTNEAAVLDALNYLRRIIVPAGITFTINSEPVAQRRPVTSVTETLPTLIPGEDGVMHRTQRQTTVTLYEPLQYYNPTIYEMGIPVVSSAEESFDVDIDQRVPLSVSRDNVPPSFLAAVRVITLNAAVEAHALAPDNAAAAWVAQATADKRVSDEAVRAVLDYRFGEKRVSYDLHDTEANNKAFAQGYTVIKGPQLSKPQWEIARRAEAVKPAGQVTPSNSKWEYSNDGEPEVVIPESEWRPGMARIVRHARYLAYKLLGVHDLQVKIVNEPIRRNHAAAAYSPASGLVFNVGTLGYAWFEKSPVNQDVTALLCHELAHHVEENHLSSRYADALCDLGARMVSMALTNPREFLHSDELAFA